MLKVIQKITKNKDWVLSFVLIFSLLYGFRELSWYDSVSLLWVVFALSITLIWAEFRIWAGSKWIWLPLSLIGFMGFLHVLTGRGSEDLMGYILIPMLYSFYLLARYLGNKLAIAIVVGSVVAGLNALFIRLGDWNTVHMGIGVHHTICFVLLMGMIVAPPKWRLYVIAFSIPTVLITKSDEGLVLLALIAGVYLWRRYWSHKLLLILPSLFLVAAVVVPNLDRFESLDRMTTHRQIAYIEWFQEGNLFYGDGWNYDTSKTTIHNAPLKLSSHYGLVAGISWLVIMFWGLWRYRYTRYFYAFLLILGASMLDHYLWTYMAIWPFIILGLAEVSNGSLNKLSSSNPSSSSIPSHRYNHPSSSVERHSEGEEG